MAAIDSSMVRARRRKVCSVAHNGSPLSRPVFDSAQTGLRPEAMMNTGIRRSALGRKPATLRPAMAIPSRAFSF